MSITKLGHPILSMDDWRRLAPPKDPDKQWKANRSAMETARAWLENGGQAMPAEILATIRSHADFGEVLEWEAEPEVRLRFDSFGGETRNSDMVVHATDAHGPFLVAVEAKADETFSVTLLKALIKAREAKLKSPDSNRVTRIEQLKLAMLEAPRAGEPQDDALYYQLFTACAGALCEAERWGYSRAIMLVHEFISCETTDGKHAKNAADLNRYLWRLSHDANLKIHDGQLAGPFVVPGTPLLKKVPLLYVGKACRSLRTP